MGWNKMDPRRILCFFGTHLEMKRNEEECKDVCQICGFEYTMAECLADMHCGNVLLW